MTDSVSDLTHDHRDINQRVLAVSGALRQLDGDTDGFSAFTVGISELHDLLFAHFAREEEGLFPFLADALPDLAGRVHDMTIAHDTICGALTRARHLATSPDNLEAVRTMYERFELAYATHASTETALLADLETRLAPDQRAALEGLLDGL